jgi:hypothetical protein
MKPLNIQNNPGINTIAAAMAKITFFEFPAQESHSKLSITNQKDEDLSGTLKNGHVTVTGDWA